MTPEDALAAIRKVLDEDPDTPIEDILVRLRYMRVLIAKGRSQVATLTLRAETAERALRAKG